MQNPECLTKSHAVHHFPSHRKHGCRLASSCRRDSRAYSTPPSTLRQASALALPHDGCAQSTDEATAKGGGHGHEDGPEDWDRDWETLSPSLPLSTRFSSPPLSLESPEPLDLSPSQPLSPPLPLFSPAPSLSPMDRDIASKSDRDRHKDGDRDEDREKDRDPEWDREMDGADNSDRDSDWEPVRGINGDDDDDRDAGVDTWDRDADDVSVEPPHKRPRRSLHCSPCPPTRLCPSPSQGGALTPGDSDKDGDGDADADRNGDGGAYHNGDNARAGLMVPAAVIPEVVQVATERQVRVWLRHTIANHSASSLPQTPGAWARALVNEPLRPLRLDEHVKTDFAEHLVQRLHCEGALVCTGAPLQPGPMATPIQNHCGRSGGGAPQHTKQSREHPQQQLHSAPPHCHATPPEPAPAPTGSAGADRTSGPTEQGSARPDPQEQPQAPPRQCPRSKPSCGQRALRACDDQIAACAGLCRGHAPCAVAAVRKGRCGDRAPSVRRSQVRKRPCRGVGPGGPLHVHRRDTLHDSARAPPIDADFHPHQRACRQRERERDVAGGKESGGALGSYCQLSRERMDAEGRGRHRAPEYREYSRWEGRRGVLDVGKGGGCRSSEPVLTGGEHWGRANLGRTEQGTLPHPQDPGDIAVEPRARSPRVVLVLVHGTRRTRVRVKRDVPLGHMLQQYRRWNPGKRLVFKCASQVLQEMHTPADYGFQDGAGIFVQESLI